METNFVINENGIKLEVGGIYYYFNIGLGAIKTHNVLRFSDANQFAVASDGKVSVDHLFYTYEDCETVLRGTNNVE